MNFTRFDTPKPLATLPGEGMMSPLPQTGGAVNGGCPHGFQAQTGSRFRLGIRSCVDVSDRRRSRPLGVVSGTRLLCGGWNAHGLCGNPFRVTSYPQSLLPSSTMGRQPRSDRPATAAAS